MAKNTSKAAAEPMDAGAPEVSGTDRVTTNNQRNVYAIDTLVAEVKSLFPETVVETSNYNGRNAALDVQFATTIEAQNGELRDLLHLIKEDERVAEVLVDDEDGLILVSFHGNARTQDSREPFGLNEAWGVLDEAWGVLAEAFEEGSL